MFSLQDLLGQQQGTEAVEQISQNVGAEHDHPLWRGQTGHMFGPQSLPVAQSGDVNLVVASTFIFAVFILIVNLLVDLSYGIIDPRVRLA